MRTGSQRLKKNKDGNDLALPGNNTVQEFQRFRVAGVAHHLEDRKEPDDVEQGKIPGEYNGKDYGNDRDKIDTMEICVAYRRRSVTMPMNVRLWVHDQSRRMYSTVKIKRQIVMIEKSRFRTESRRSGIVEITTAVVLVRMMRVRNTWMKNAVRSWTGDSSRRVWTRVFTRS
jgi:hypothetical protein